MRLIIEGVDKSGKSTLIETLKNKFPKAVQLKLMTKPYDSSQEETEKLFEVYTTMKEMTDKKDYVYIFDRYFQSELVYSYIRGNDRLATKEGKDACSSASDRRQVSPWCKWSVSDRDGKTAVLLGEVFAWSWLRRDGQR